MLCSCCVFSFFKLCVQNGREKATMGGTSIVQYTVYSNLWHNYTLLYCTDWCTS